MCADEIGCGEESGRGVHLPAGGALRVHPAGCGVREGVGGGDVGLDVEDGCAVQQVGLGDLEHAALDGDETDAG